MRRPPGLFVRRFESRIAWLAAVSSPPYSSRRAISANGPCRTGPRRARLLEEGLEVRVGRVKLECRLEVSVARPKRETSFDYLAEASLLLTRTSTQAPLPECSF